MEASDHFTIEGYIEMMGYFKHFNGHVKDSSLYVEWVNSVRG